MTAMNTTAYEGVSEHEYKRRIRAWTMYDWANSAFATTILAAVLPVYYSQVAGSTLPSAAVATAYWSAGLSVSLFIVALMSPILGTISDIVRNKKRLLSIFVCVGTVSTGLMVLISTGDWMLASILFVLSRIGFTAANVFYDALLPHIAKKEDQDKVSTRGYAMGYLGGGLLLAINIAMIQFLPGTWGPRLSFLSVGIWWAAFSIPIFLRVPEPPSATAVIAKGETVISVSFKRLFNTLKDIRHYSDLFKFLLAFLIYNDGIGTIIGVSAIYGAELGFGSVEMILALLMVQFVGIPYSLIFGRLPDIKEKRRPIFLAFIIFNMIALPVIGVFGCRMLPGTVTGGPLPPFPDTAIAVGEGSYLSTDEILTYTGDWEEIIVPADEIGAKEDAAFAISSSPGSLYDFAFNGQKVKLGYSIGPDYGTWAVMLDNQPLIDEDSGDPMIIDAYHSTLRYGASRTLMAPAAGEHILSLINTGDKSPESTGTRMTIHSLEVLPPIRHSNLGMIIGIIIGIEVVGLLLSLLLGQALFSRLAEHMNTKNSILLALLMYALVAIWGFFLNSVIEFWFLAWMVSVVQGGSQALSRSLYASMSPASKSGEFFGLFGIMEKFSAILGPLVFAAAVATFGSSRPAVLIIVAFFIVGGYVLTLVNVDEGRRTSSAEDAALMQS